MGDCNFGNIQPIKVPKSNAGRNQYFDKNFSKSSELCYLEPGLYLSTTDIVEAINTLNQEKHNHSEGCISVKVSRRTEKN